MRKVVSTKKAPGTIGPYSQAVEVSGTLYISGQVPIDPETGKLSGDTITEQTEQVLKNIRFVVNAAGYSMKEIVKTTCMLQDMNDFAEMNKAYEKFFPDNPPARAAYEVARLPLNVKIEIEAIAAR
ncbi:MAG: RidA family protein [Bacteroidales bacterium]|nr:RidA family protein [Bacteroidales bacterium]